MADPLTIPKACQGLDTPSCSGILDLMSSREVCVTVQGSRVSNNTFRVPEDEDLRVKIGSDRLCHIHIKDAALLHSVLVLTARGAYLEYLGADVILEKSGQWTILRGSIDLDEGQKFSIGGKTLFYSSVREEEAPPGESEPEAREVTFAYQGKKVLFAIDNEFASEVPSQNTFKAQAYVRGSRVWLQPWHPKAGCNTFEGIELVVPGDIPSSEAVELIQSLPPGTMLSEVQEALEASGISLTLKGVVKAFTSS